MGLTVIVISFNTRDLTLACLRSVHEGIAKARNEGCDVVVVDNVSTDDSVKAIAARFPDIRLIRSERNLGFAAANNRAAKESTAEYLLLLNPDTVVLDGAIDRLLAFAREHPRAGIWGGRTVFADRSLNPASCWGRQTPWSLVCTATGLSSLLRGSSLFNPEGYGGWKRDCQREVDIVSGCFLLIRRELWDQLGGFDERFFVYGEDADLCLRARKLGYRPMITPEATIVHYGGASEKVRADKLVRLLTAKTMLIRQHWSPSRVGIGVRLLAAWPLSRLIAFSVLRCVGFKRDALSVWREVWRRKREWYGP